MGTKPFGKTGTTVISQYEPTQENPFQKKQAFQKPSYSDDRIACSGRDSYKLPDEDFFEMTKDGLGAGGGAGLKRRTQDFDGYGGRIVEDVEEDWGNDFEDDDETAGHGRLTDIADGTEMSQVMDMYECFLKKPPNNKLSTIREQSF